MDHGGEEEGDGAIVSFAEPFCHWWVGAFKRKWERMKNESRATWEDSKIFVKACVVCRCPILSQTLSKAIRHCPGNPIISNKNNKLSEQVN